MSIFCASVEAKSDLLYKELNMRKFALLISGLEIVLNLKQVLFILLYHFQVLKFDVHI